MRYSNAIRLGAVMAVSAIMFSAGPRAAEDQWQLAGPYSFENLSVFLIRTDQAMSSEELLSLDEALEKGYLTVFETGNVGELQVENTSDWPVYIQSGTIVKGGRQDRMLPHDIVVAARSGKKTLASFCVEQGRWSARGDESDVLFKVAPVIVADKDILLAAKVEASQSKVWEEVASKVDKFGTHARGGRAASPVSPTSLPLALENRDIQNKTLLYVESIRTQTDSCPDAVGMVVIINGEICSADLYRDQALFEKSFPKLIDAAAIEALERKPDEGVDRKGVSAGDVQAWLSAAENGDIETKNVGGTMFLRSIETDSAISFESLSDTAAGQWIHKNILSK